MHRFAVLWAMLLFQSYAAPAQEIPLNSWRLHPSFSRIIAVGSLQDKLFAAANHAVLIAEGNRVESLTRPYLGSSLIRCLASDAVRQQILIGYADGHLDLLQGRTITPFDRIRQTSGITGSRAINHILPAQLFAYLATDFGVVVFDLQQRNIRETWRNLGRTGELYRVYMSAIRGDTIFLATENGVQAGNLNDNLLDFSRWKHFDQGTFARAIHDVVAFNNRIYTAINDDGIYSYETGTWTHLHFLQNESSYRLFATSSHLYVVAGNRLYRISPTHDVEEIIHPLLTEPLGITEFSGRLWVGDARNGLLRQTTQGWDQIIPGGPSFDTALRLRQHERQILALSGGYTSAFLPAGIQQPVNVFRQGTWSVRSDWLQDDVTDVAFQGNRTVVASFGGGLQVRTAEQVVNFTAANSPISGGRVTALASSPGGIWVANYNSAQPLHRLLPDNTFESYTFPISAARYPLDLLMDDLGQVWMRLNPVMGGGILVFNHATLAYIYLTEMPGSGGLPSRNVYALQKDRNGNIWAGTDAGVAYFTSPQQVLSGTVNAVKPVFGGRFLLRDEKVTAIAVDGGNRKWFGTESGLWLFTEDADTEILHFTSRQSPLPSDIIRSLAVDPESGEIFIATDQGLASYRSDATAPALSSSRIRIFPNPVPPQFAGWVGISGLGENTTVRITDLSGRLIWQTRSNGGTASWHVRDYSGSRPPAGIYLVFAVSEDGSETLIGKLALIN